MSLDDRLARDAERWRKDDHAPSFDDALDAATQARANRLLPVVAAAVIVLIGIVIAALLTSSRQATPAGHDGTSGIVYRSNIPSASLVMSSSAPAVPPPSTRPDGIRVRYEAVPDVPAAAVVVDPAKPTTMSLMIADNGGPECSVANVSATSVHESDTTVQVQLAGTRTTETDAKGDTLTHGCTAVHYYPVDVTLAQPLGERSVLVGATSQPLPVLRIGELGKPAYLPSGYALRMDRSAEELGASLSLMRTYARSSRGGLLLIYIRAITSPDGQPPTRTGTIDVNGHRAVFHLGEGHCLAWFIRPGVYESVCDQGKLPDSQIIKIARSIKP